MSTMHCVQICDPGPGGRLELTERPAPSPGPGEVCIEVAAAGVNRPDALQRRGLYPPPPGESDLPGLEVAGEVRALGAGVTRWKIGDRVCALVAGGGYAERCLAPEGSCLPVPAGRSWAEAAALPETVFTVWANVFERGRLAPGESILVHGGAGGIGTTAIQMARALRGADVITTCGSAEKAEACRRLGAARAIEYRREDYAEATLAHTGGRGVHVVLDILGGEHLARNLSCMAEEGRHVSIAFLEGAKAKLPIFVVMAKRLSLSGSTLRARPAAEKARLAAAIYREVWPKIEAGEICAVIDQRLPLAEAAAAHARLEARAHVGKIVLEP